MKTHGLTPVVLSSYLNINTDDAFKEKLENLISLLNAFGFSKVRIFPGSGLDPKNEAAVERFEERLQNIAQALSTVEILLETHDHSLADDPALLVKMLERLQIPNVGLLYQPSLFLEQESQEQMHLQKHLVRHLHLQNRDAEQGFATIAKGVVPWPKILAELGRRVPMTLEFVPKGICPLAAFNLEAVLQQARADADFADALWDSISQAESAPQS